MSRIAFPLAAAGSAGAAGAAGAAAPAYLVSICIPTFNRLADLQICLAGLLQKYGDSDLVEIVVIDNGSSDGTGAFLGQYPHFSNTAFYLRQDNAGFDINLLDSFYAARGKYVHFLGDDDVLASGGFDAVIGILQSAQPDLVVSDYTVQTRRKRFNAVGKPGAFFDSVEALFSYAGHHVTFMSSLTVRKQDIPVQLMAKYINFKFMHLSLILEMLAGRTAHCVFSAMPVALATDGNPATYDVAEVFLSSLARSFQLNAKRLNSAELARFFESVMGHCIGSGVSLPKFFFANGFVALAGYGTLARAGFVRIYLMRNAVRLAKKLGFGRAAARQPA